MPVLSSSLDTTDEGYQHTRRVHALRLCLSPCV